MRSNTIHPVPTPESDARDLEWFESHRPFVILAIVVFLGILLGIFAAPKRR